MKGRPIKGGDLHREPCRTADSPRRSTGVRLDEGPPAQGRRQGANSRPCDLGFRRAGRECWPGRVAVPAVLGG